MRGAFDGGESVAGVGQLHAAHAGGQLGRDRRGARNVRRGVHHGFLAEGQLLARKLAVHKERPRADTAHGAEQHLLRQLLEAHLLEVLDAVPLDHVAPVEDRSAQLIRTLVLLDDLELLSALVRVVN